MTATLQPYLTELFGVFFGGACVLGALTGFVMARKPHWEAAIMKVARDCFTERDGVSWCIVRLGSVPVISALIYKFLIAPGAPDYISLAGGVAAIWAAIAFKNTHEEDGHHV